ncbi:MAG: branched-chain amino acid transport system ATP-binding protein [Azoarcus sp.]|nr:branched-chain amino acid transport system ATP-binding protein [Azoarcus sp.]
MTALLETQGLHKAYGSLVVTRDVNLAVEEGECHVVIGPNGAGKSSLVGQLTGTLRPTSGRVLFGGRDITGLPPEQIRRAGIARTYQKNNLFRTLTVRENVRLAVQAHNGRPIDPFGVAGRDARQNEAVDRVLEQLQLRTVASRRVSELSYGEQRQLEIALALAGDPKMLVLDEPTSGMSPAETEAMITLIRSLARRLTLLLVEHDMKVVFALADRITVLHYGEVLLCDEPRAIASNERVREVYLGGKH